MFSIERIIYIKKDLALNNLQRLICHKTKQTKQTKPSRPVIKISAFSFCMRNTECLYDNNSETHISITMDLTDLKRSLLIMI